ncbi:MULTISPECIES: hypothetical protein [Brevibacillus]|uniref:Small acid-soluble spore protein P n=1 Tax=Brevibacillus laterosporus TaxID=1465 RepID=A0AAP3DH38_BRELA|nr:MULTISPECIES: hypothetical protein [Brevibacillus]MBM7111229.1 hypothetical protein [Brevibacillus laterosporus]MCG7319208.1 hypothetical protein [Brevibacillus laterosporus]MCR8938296.1 hypothetical protein [Brevibacillus laterosporus]MCR8980561.1 hypothetical protein [Brevibacillus laterosporus]MCZ0807716.1 hypothetical protein [Brevibacillus laterosporus]
MSRGKNDFPQAPEQTFTDPKMSAKPLEFLSFQNPRKTEHHKTQEHKTENRDH